MSATSQKRNLSNADFCYCTIPNNIIKTQLEKFVYRHVKDRSLIVLKLPVVAYDTSAYKITLTQMLFKHDLRSNPPRSYTNIKGITVLIYGNVNFKCIPKNYQKFSDAMLQKYLISQTTSKKQADGSIMISETNFDREILEITIQNGVIVSEKQLGAG